MNISTRKEKGIKTIPVSAFVFPVRISNLINSEKGYFKVSNKILFCPDFTIKS